MQKVLLDSNIISYFLRGEPSVITELEKYQESFEQITFSILTYYEIVSGLKYRDSVACLCHLLIFLLEPQPYSTI